jgi:hypothetical protein
MGGSPVGAATQSRSSPSPAELAVLAWHLLTHDVDYRWAPARLTATKIRAVELAAGAPSRRAGRPGRVTLESE